MHRTLYLGPDEPLHPYGHGQGLSRRQLHLHSIHGFRFVLLYAPDTPLPSADGPPL